MDVEFAKKEIKRLSVVIQEQLYARSGFMFDRSFLSDMLLVDRKLNKALAYGRRITNGRDPKEMVKFWLFCEDARDSIDDH